MKDEARTKCSYWSLASSSTLYPLSVCVAQFACDPEDAPCTYPTSAKRMSITISGVYC